MERSHAEEIHQRSNHVLRTRTCVQMDCSEDAITCATQQTSSHISWRIKIALVNYFEQHTKEVWERNWMNPEMQTR